MEVQYPFLRHLEVQKHVVVTGYGVFQYQLVPCWFG